MSELLVFDFEGTKLRVILDAERKPWFVAKEVCDALGYANARDALATHVKAKQKNTVAIHDGIRGNPNQAIINESGLYTLIMRSKLGNAERFQDWVTEEVLPSIRSTGSYIRPGPLRNAPQALPSEYRQRLDERSAVADLLVQKGVAAPTANAIMLRMCVVDGLLSEAAERECRAAFAFDWDDAPTLNPTQIGKKLGGMSAVMVNKMLETRGLQRNAAKASERPRWEPTEEGKPYCSAVPYQARNEHVGMQLKWTPRVLEVLREPLSESLALPEPEPKKEYLF